MAIPQITEDWSARTFQRGQRARRRFLATGYGDEEAARSASPVQPGEGFNLDPRLISSEPTVSTPQGPGNYILDIDYSLDGGSGGGDGNATNLLNSPPLYFPDIQESREPVDRDIYGNAITNSAGDPPAQNFTDDVTSIFYTYKRYEDGYDGQKVLAYSNKVNLDTFIMPGFGSVEPGQAKCKSIRLAKEFDRNTRVMQIIYSFEIREDGFDLRFADKGRRGYTAVDGFPVKDVIYTSSGNAVTTDVLLSGYGVPLKLEGETDSFTIGKAHLAPIPYQLNSDTVVREYQKLAVFLRYKRKKPIAFSGLNLEA